MWFRTGRVAVAVTSGLDHVVVHVRPAVPVELPGVADLAHEIHVQVGDEELLVLLGRLGDDLAARVREIARPVVVVRAELLLLPHPVDRPYPVAVRYRGRRLLDEPTMHAHAARRRRRDGPDRRPVRPEHPPPL